MMTEQHAYQRNTQRLHETRNAHGLRKAEESRKARAIAISQTDSDRLRTVFFMSSLALFSLLLLGAGRLIGP